MKFNFYGEDYSPRNICNVAVATVGAGVVGAASIAYAAHTASKAQTKATDKAAQIATDQYATTRGDFAPFREAGLRAQTELEGRLPFLTSPIAMDQAALEKTPGYQWTLGQGLKATQNSAAARGLGVSGAALKGAATFATGLADNTYKTQFDLENTNRTNAYNRLMGLIQTGSGAAQHTATAGTYASKMASDAAIGQGNAQAGAATAMGQSGARLAGDVGGYAMYKGLYGNPTQTGGIMGPYGNNQGNYNPNVPGGFVGA